MVDEVDMSGVRAYSFPDGTTWVGKFKAVGKLEKVTIFRTPTTETFEGPSVGMVKYLTEMYQSKILESRAHQIEKDLPTADFNTTMVMAEWTLSTSE